MIAEASSFRPSEDPVLEEVRGRVPSDGSVDIVMLSGDASQSAVFAGVALAPRDVRFFSGWDDWRARRRAIFFRDARAANAAEGPPPAAATIVLTVDGQGRIAAPR